MTNSILDQTKRAVHDYWDAAACGEDLYLGGTTAADYDAQAQIRYQLEPYIEHFARFDRTGYGKLLEIGVGLGADHQRFVASGAETYGIDLTFRAVNHTRSRLSAAGMMSQLAVGDAENLAFPDNSFDRVYSWGVLHHSPDTRRAIGEVWRILRPSGNASIMIYHKWSIVGFMLWVRYALLRMRPWISLAQIYSLYLESPGTKAYSVAEARALFAEFSDVSIRIVLTHGDLLESSAGQRHGGWLLAVARAVWPRWLFRRLTPRLGLFMLVDARK